MDMMYIFAVNVLRSPTFYLPKVVFKPTPMSNALLRYVFATLVVFTMLNCYILFTMPEKVNWEEKKTFDSPAVTPPLVFGHKTTAPKHETHYTIPMKREHPGSPSFKPFPLSELCNSPRQPYGTLQPDPRERFEAVPNGFNNGTVKVRFIATHTQRDAQLFEFVATAHLAGVPVEVLGLGWKDFSSINRQHLIADYIEAAELNDDDVVMMLDSDMLFTGDDLYPLMAEFVSNSPATAEETNALLVRTYKQTAPVLLSAEVNCMRLGGVRPQDCTKDFDKIEELSREYSEAHNLPYWHNRNGDRNPNRYLNNGLVMGRVWALKRLRYAFFNYKQMVRPVVGREWVMDQAIYAALYVALRFWEFKRHDMSLSAGQLNAPPYGMVGGMIALDFENKFVGPYHQFNVNGALEYSGEHISQRNIAGVLKTKVQQRLKEGDIKQKATAVGAPMAAAAVSFIKRPLPAGSESGPEGTFSVPLTYGVEPPLWHFCGNEKVRYLPAFSHILPTRIILDVFPELVNVTLQVFWSAPSTRLWSVESTTKKIHSFALQQSPSMDVTALCRIIKKE